eukprot:7391831-Prymnesium_polylepis.1
MIPACTCDGSGGCDLCAGICWPGCWLIAMLDLIQCDMNFSIERGDIRHVLERHHEDCATVFCAPIGGGGGWVWTPLAIRRAACGKK